MHAIKWRKDNEMKRDALFREITVGLILRRIFLLLIILFGFGIFSSISAQRPLPPEARRNTPIIIEGNNMFPPFEFLDERGQPAGFNVELTRIVMNKLGITNYQIQLKSWPDVLSDYQNGKVDLIMGMIYTSARAKTYKFGAMHGTEYVDVIYRKGSFPIGSLSLLKGKKIIIHKKSINEDILKEAGFEKQIVYVNSPAEGLMLLSRGRYDVMVSEHEMTLYLIFKLGISNLESNDLGLPPMEYCYVGKNSKFLDAIEHTIYDLKADGTYETLFKSWFTAHKNFGISHVVYIIIIVLAVCALVLTVFIIMLRREVGKAKRQLEEKNGRLALAIQAGEIGVWGFNVQTKRFYNVESNFYPAEGLTLDDELLLVHPDDRWVFINTLEQISNGLFDHKRICYRIQPNKDGKWIYVEVESTQLRDKDGKVESVIGTYRDITELKLSQLKADDLLRKYSTMFSSTLVGIEYYDNKGILQEMNALTCKLFGFSYEQRQEVLDMHYSLFDDPIMKDYAFPGMKEQVHRVFEVDFNVVRKHYPMVTRRDTAIIEIQIVPIREDNERNNCYIVSYKDVTALHTLQRELKENVRKTQIAINASNIVMWETFCDDLTQCICHRDPIFNYQDTSVLTYEILSPIVHPDDRTKMEDLYEVLRSKKNETVNTDLRLWYDIDKQWHYCTITSTPLNIDENGLVTKYVGFRRDDTKLIKMSEDVRIYSEKLDYILKVSDIKVWQYDIPNKMLTVMNGVNDIYETMSLEEYCNRLLEPDRSQVIALFSKMDSGSIGSFSNQRRLTYTKEGKRTRYVIFSGIPSKDRYGNIVGYFGLRRDITDLIEIQLRLEKEKEKAQQADKLKSAFLANMSHEIRTPLNSIVGFSNLLEDTEDKSERDQYIQLINTNNDLLLRLINDILDLSKIEAGVVEMFDDEFDMSSCFNDITTSLQKKLTNPDIRFVCVNPYENCRVLFDKNRMEQIITNFVTNAFKYTSKGEVKVEYHYTEGGIRISVKDTGIGIPFEKQHLIFHRFEKLDTFAQGTGLGLSICKAITDSCHGRIGFSSTPDVGSTFWVWVPCTLTAPLVVKDNSKEGSNA